MATPEEELFDEWLAQDAYSPPRFHPIPDEIAPLFTLQLEKFKRRMEAIQAKVEWKKRIEIYVDFVDDGECNAAADVYKNKGLIGLYRGLVLLPIDLFLRMFSHPAFLKTAGNPRDERRSAQHSEGVVNDYDALIKNRQRENRPLYRPKLPVDRTRRLLAEVCTDIVWRFLAWHETVHILHGHIDYLRDIHPNWKMLDFQAMELWSDGVAGMGSLSNLLTSFDKAGAYAVLNDDRQKLFLWSLSLFTLFRLWGFQINPMKLRGPRHPPNPVRFAMLADGACSDFARSFPAIGDAYDDIVRAGRVAADEGIAFCGGARLRDEDVKKIDDPLVAAHCEALLDHHRNVLVPELTKRAYIKVTYDSLSLPSLQTPPVAAP